MTAQLSGISFGLAAFVLWGFMPVYWKFLQQVPALEILCHRILWSCLFLVLIVSLQKRWPEVRSVIRDVRTLKKLFLSGLLVGANWLIYIAAVNSGHVLESSLGYYITPMANILIGFSLLGERLNRLQSFAVFCALAGVCYSLLVYGDLPFYALGLAVSFSFYGYARKKIAVAPIPGLLVETSLLVLPALTYIGFRTSSSASLFLADPQISLLLAGAGVATSLPLLWFSAAARHLWLSTIGILQYIAPTITFFLGVFLYRETFAQDSLITFLFIWLAVAIYCADAWRRRRALRPRAVPLPKIEKN